MEQDKQFEKNFFDEAYEYGRFCRTKGDIEVVLEDSYRDIKLSDEEMKLAIEEALKIQDTEIYWLDFAERAVMSVLRKRPKEAPKDLLNDTLKMIGLETNQGFLVDDNEYRGTTFYIDSFGDIYTNGEDEDVYHEYLTLGRILTQYYDKVVPMEGEKI